MKLIELLSNTKPNSTVLQPFYWVMLILLGLIYIFNSNKTDRWILLILIVALLIVVIAFVVAYFICLTKNPDNLRSESYNMNKLEIESGIKNKIS